MKLLSAALALVLSLAAGLGTASAQPQPVRIVVNDVQVPVPAAAQFEQGVLIAAIAPVVQAFGATAAWDPAAATMIVTGAGGTTVRLIAGQTTATAGAASWTLPVPPSVRGGTLVGPVASVLRRLSAFVKEDPAAGTLEATTQITDVAWHTDAGTVVVSVAASGPVRAVDRVFHDPERIVVDLTSAVIRLTDPDRAIGSGPVVGMRAAQFQLHPYVTRVVFDLAHPVPERIAVSPGTVTVTLVVGSAIPGAAATGPARVPQTPATTQVTVPPAAVQPPPLRDSRPPAPTAAYVPQAPQAPLHDSRPPVPTTAYVPPAPQSPLRDSRPPAPTVAYVPPVRQAPLQDSRPPVTAGGPPAPAGAAHAPAATPTPVASGSGAPAVAALPAGVPEPLALPPLPPFADRPGAFHVNDVTYDEGAGRLVIHASQHITYSVAQWVYPDRLAIDISGGVFLDRRKDVEIGTSSIRNIVVSQFDLRPNVTRILVHLNQKVAYATASADRGRTLTVTFGGAAVRSQAAVGPGPGAVASPGAPTVVIDPGHGGGDPGAIGPTGLHEADVTLAIGKMVRDLLERQGVHTALTRTDDSSVALEDRPDLAQRDGGILFLSIHANASVNRGAQGTTTYYYTPQSQALAAAVQTEVARALGEPDRGVQTERFYVIVNAPMPSALIETLFISNPKEETMLRDPAVQQRIADAIARGVEDYLVGQSQATSH